MRVCHVELPAVSAIILTKTVQVLPLATGNKKRINTIIGPQPVRSDGSKTRHSCRGSQGRGKEVLSS